MAQMLGILAFFGIYMLLGIGIAWFIDPQGMNERYHVFRFSRNRF
jgi:hypothetical protein